MHCPTDEQRRVLDSTARLRVVRAAPGSGKTWLVAEALRRALEGWTRSCQGIAALSFTNIAGDEIARSLGWSPVHPHFVGTLDAFIFRFIVRPFGWLFEPGLKNVRLVPAEAYGYLSDDEPWFRYHRISIFGKGSEPVSIFRINFVGEKAGVPILWAQTKVGVLPVPQDQCASVLKRKMEMWHRSGRVSHSDAAFVAVKVLEEPGNAWVSKILADRFPFLIVDELQDTGLFLGRVVRALVSHSGCQAVLVGDPDQAIFEFTGARPELFDEFERLSGAEKFSIDTTRRCPERVCRVATQLTAHGRQFSSGQASSGHSTLVSITEDASAELCHLLSSARRRAGAGVVRLVTRSNQTLQILGAREPTTAPQFRSSPLATLYRAVYSLRAGDTKHALAASAATLGPILLGTTTPSDAELELGGLNEGEWKRLVVDLLLEAHREDHPEDWHAWGCRLVERIRSVAARHGRLEKVKFLRGPAKGTVGMPRAPENLSGDKDPPSTLTIQTVHAVKGETHHTTVLYVPPGRHVASWWSQTKAEERRIAFVAATRPSDTFVLAVHAADYDWLKKQHPEFVSVFEKEGSLDEILRCWNEVPGATTVAD